MKDETEFLNFFIPGGPCISGKYWDLYMSMTGFTGHRIMYLNHENSYNHKTSPGFKEIVENFKQQIEFFSKGKKINLIAHSFGAWVVLSALKDEDFNHKISKVILISLPLSVDHTQEVNFKMKQLCNFTVTDNKSFKLFWKSIFPLYIAKQLEQNVENVVTNEVFWEGNDRVLLDTVELQELLKLIKLNSKIKLIWGEKDIITPPNESLEFEIIREAGHFPMLESTENFTALLKRSLSK